VGQSLSLPGPAIAARMVPVSEVDVDVVHAPATIAVIARPIR
jgi:hypothetical protein